MQSKAATVEEYLAELPEDRRAAISAIRDVVLANLPKGYEETMQYGMITYVVPHSLYPAGYHCDPKQALSFVSVASQKNHMAVYLSCLYQNPGTEAWFREEYARRGKKLDMGKSCVRFTKLENLALDLIGESIAQVPVDAFVANYETQLAAAGIKRKKA